jgi:serine/threonine protein kinase
MLNLIGKGNFAKVMLAKENGLDTPYAVKIIKKRQVLKKK